MSPLWISYEKSHQVWPSPVLGLLKVSRVLGQKSRDEVVNEKAKIYSSSEEETFNTATLGFQE